jgi:hypothetical protein
MSPSSTKNSDDVVSAARAILRGGIIAPRDVPTVLAAGRILARDGGDLCHDDHRIMKAAGGIDPKCGDAPKPKPGTPYDADLAEANAALAECAGVLEARSAATFSAAAALELLLGSGSVVLLGGKRIVPNVREPGGQVRNATSVEILAAHRAADEACEAELAARKQWGRARARVADLDTARGR